MTVHQSKGLEFPVVVLWDGMALLGGMRSKPPWRVDRTTASWAVALDGLSHSEPPERDLASIEKNYLDNERRRLIYVACTRARDLLVLPKPAAAKAAHISTLLTTCEAPTVEVLEQCGPGAPAPWAPAVAPSPGPPTVDAQLEAEMARGWPEALHAACAADLEPQWASQVEPLATTDEEDSDEASPKKRREGRYGRTFGTVVHEALEMCLLERHVKPQRAVTQVAEAHQMAAHREEATADVKRALATLDQEGLGGPEDTGLRVEYPVAAQLDDARLTVGTIDLLAASDERITIIDFKTDAPPARGEPVPVAYAAQLETYARLLEATGVRGERRLRSGLLFTATGEIRWTRQDTH